MDMMAIRRRVLMVSRKNDYLKGAEWVEGKFINSGTIYDNQNAHYTENVIFLPQGIFVLKGKNGGASVKYRVHEYDENGQFIAQITAKSYRANTDVSLQFTAPQAPHGIKLSIASAFVGTLTKA